MSEVLGHEDCMACEDARACHRTERAGELEAALRTCVAAIGFLVAWCDGPMEAHALARAQGRIACSEAMAVLRRRVADGEPTYANRAEIAAAAEVFVAALGTGNRSVLIENLRNVDGRSDALNALNAALSRAEE